MSIVTNPAVKPGLRIHLGHYCWGYTTISLIEQIRLNLRGSNQAVVYGGLYLARDRWVYRFFNTVPVTQA